MMRHFKFCLYDVKWLYNSNLHFSDYKWAWNSFHFYEPCRFYWELHVCRWCLLLYRTEIMRSTFLTNSEVRNAILLTNALVFTFLKKFYLKNFKYFYNNWRAHIGFIPCKKYSRISLKELHTENYKTKGWQNLKVLIFLFYKYEWLQNISSTKAGVLYISFFQSPNLPQCLVYSWDHIYKYIFISVVWELNNYR